MPGIKDLIADRVGVPVELLEPFREISYDEATFDPEYIAEIGQVAGVGIGLALRTLEE